MLTGDKIETAISIGKSCQLIPPEKDCLLLVILNKESFKNEIQKLALSDNKIDFFIAINGDAITEILADKEALEAFTFISKTASSVVCARFSPKQKADVVRKMKELHPQKIMLSIGDGGNDVSMILEAHIGKK